MAKLLYVYEHCRICGFKREIDSGNEPFGFISTPGVIHRLDWGWGKYQACPTCCKKANGKNFYYVKDLCALADRPDFTNGLTILEWVLQKNKEELKQNKKWRGRLFLLKKLEEMNINHAPLIEWIYKEQLSSIHELWDKCEIEAAMLSILISKIDTPNWPSGNEVFDFLEEQICNAFATKGPVEIFLHIVNTTTVDTIRESFPKVGELY